MDIYNISEVFKSEIKDYFKLSLHVKRIIYKSDNNKIEGFIIQSKFNFKKLPVLIYCRGGDNLGKTKEGKKKDDKYYLFFKDKIFSDLVENGYIIFASNYRGSNFSTGKDEFGGDDINDVINLLPIIKKYKYSDEKNINFWGHSRGAMMALLAINKMNYKYINSVILTGGFYDFNVIKSRSNYFKFLQSHLNLSKDELNQRSAINFTESFKQPLLIIHGREDKAVNTSSSIRFSDKLKKQNKVFKLIIYPDMKHDFSPNLEEVNIQIINWLNKYNFISKKVTIYAFIMFLILIILFLKRKN